MLQETYIRAFNGFSAYRGGDAGAWLCKIASNVFYNHVRRGSYSNEITLEIEAKTDPSLDPGSGFNLGLFDVREAVSTLLPVLRECLLQKYYDGLTSEEIAERAGCPSATVRYRLCSAITQVRLALDPSPSSLRHCSHIEHAYLIDAGSSARPAKSAEYARR